LDKAKAYYEKHGPMTIIMARFTPFIRTFAPIVAGAAQMKYATFLTYNLIGGLIWGAGLPFLGYWLGNAIPGVEKYLMPVVIVIIVASLAPGVWHYFKEKGHSKDARILKETLGK
jgi:membrane-associated protein